MAVEMFLKFEGPPLDGESQIAGFEGQFDILSWSWGATQSGSMQSGTGGGAGKANVRDINLTKHLDKATPNLWQACISGKQFEKATLTCRKAGGDAPVPYLKLEFDKVIITSVNSGGGQGSEQFDETFHLNFSKYSMTYTPQKDDGTADSEVGPIGHDIRKNEKV